MDAELLQNLGVHPNSAGQQQAVLYFEQLKNSAEGWRHCVALLTSNTCQDDRVKFFCFQVIEFYVKTHYQNSPIECQIFIKKFLSQWIQIQCINDLNEKKFLRNKAAQIFSLVFVSDYPLKWSSFFTDLLQTLKLGPQAVDNYLRVLMAIDSEVTDRDIAHTQLELERNTVIKDAMRESDVNKLVESWFQILERYQNSHPCIAAQCLQVIGSYISWIDISLIANNQFVPLLVHQLLKPELRENAADCLHDIISKGMDPLPKAKLVESLVTVLDSVGVLKPLKEDESDYTVKMARLVNGMGLNLIDCYNKLLKAGNERDASEVQLAIERKVATMLEFLSNDYDDVSLAVMEFTREYIHTLKSKVMVTEVQKNHIVNMLIIVINKMKFDESYNFESEGEDEATFIEYRKQLKVIYDNLAGLDKEMVLDYTEKYVTNSLQQWQNLSFMEVEAAITFLYLIGEAVPATGGNHFSGDQVKADTMISMMQMLVTSGVSSHPHAAVKLQFFETVSRYEKFFNVEPHHISTILTTFLDERGMRNSNCKVRSRCAYLFSKLVKNLKGQMQRYTKQVLHMLKDLLILSAPVANNGIIHSLLSDDDQLFVYEACGILIVAGSFSPQEKEMYMRELLSPLLSKYTILVEQLLLEQHEKRQEVLAMCLCHAMALTSRTSKAFSNQQTMKANGCVQVYLDALQVFLGCLQVPHQQYELQSGVRQFLHRMVVCLEEELLPFIPTASQGLLKTSDTRSFQEYVPLLIQIISKFKKEIVPFLQQAFMPIVNAIINALATPIEDNDEEARRGNQMLQRSYFQFIAAIVTNNVTEVLDVQESQCLEQVMTSIIRGAVEFPDPVAQKTCFSILKKLIDMWGNRDESNGFIEFMYKNIVPACFLAPMKNSFDLTDAQTLCALSESALCMKAVYNKRGDELISYLTQLLPTLNFTAAMIEEYCQALQSDTKVFKSFLKFFFQRART